MRELFMKLFEMSHFDSGIKITPFSGAHIVYLLLIVGGLMMIYGLYPGTSLENAETVANALEKYCGLH